MKKLFLSMVALVVATMSFAQGSLLATLSHEGEISVYYGTSALKVAYNAAANGDVITLSSGQFNAVNISKAITLRGAGMSMSTDSINAHEATIIQGEFTITQANTLNGRITMEGLYFNQGIKYAETLKNAQFLKCRFLNFIAENNAVITNTSFIHCRFCKGYTQKANSNASFINSIVCCPDGPATSSVEFYNCFVKFDNQSSFGAYANSINNALYKNCIIQVINRSYPIPSNCTAYNCIGLTSDNMFDDIKGKNSTNKFVSDITKVFKTYAITAENGWGSYIKDSDSFELTATAARIYLGTDGTQVGIYGGNLPYDENPTIPLITKCNVASKSTADGKLSVDIEVKAAEY